MQADQDTSFTAMDAILRQYVNIVDADPGVDTVNGFTGGGRGGATNSARMFISLKPLNERKVSARRYREPAPPETGAGTGRDLLSAGFAGSARGRAAE